MTGCGSESEKNIIESEKKKKTEKPIFHEFASEDRICDVIDQEKLIKAFHITTELNIRAEETNGNFACFYFWEFTDEVLWSKHSFKNELKNKGELDESAIRRLRHGSGQIDILLLDLKRYATNFTPVPNEQQLIEWLIATDDQNQTIDNLGESAYWSPIRDGELYVNVKGFQIVITPMIGNTQEEDLENAKKIYSLIGQ